MHSESPEAAQFRIGAEVLASDGKVGELIRVIIDPVAQALAHLVVAPKHHQALGRLVPVGLAEADGEQIRLRCTTAEFDQLDEAEDIQILPAGSNVWGYGPGQAFSWPYYGLGLGGGIGAGGMGGGLIGLHDAPAPIVTDEVPVGEVQVRRGDKVHASDGWIGSVQGLVINPGTNHVSHVLLQEGHLWGRKQVAVPIGTVSREDDEIRVELTKQQVADLPAITLSSSPTGEAVAGDS
jgi:sporulation protein YlmC with PRC-barrel domain